MQRAHTRTKRNVLNHRIDTKFSLSCYPTEKGKSQGVDLAVLLVGLRVAVAVSVCNSVRGRNERPVSVVEWSHRPCDFDHRMAAVICWMHRANVQKSARG